jgi:hypothetical protein
MADIGWAGNANTHSPEKNTRGKPSITFAPDRVPCSIGPKTYLRAVIFGFDSAFFSPTFRAVTAMMGGFLFILGVPVVNSGEPIAKTNANSSAREIDWTEARAFWAFQAPKTQPAPVSKKHADWPRRKIDAFTLARMEAAGLSPNAEADPRVWLRRVTFDLTGLPPSIEEMDAFLREEDTASAIERLLASPHFGERWARLWLDVARYAEDQAHIVGKNTILDYPNAWLYRDWVIGAFNRDMPYDEFIRQQLAADLIAPDEADSHAALGFIGLGPKYYRRGDPSVMADEWEDRVDTLTRGLLGLTVACARCHDHKYDPIPQADYYALAGVFASTEMFNRPLDPSRKTNDDGQTKSEQDAIHIIREKPKSRPLDLAIHIRGDASTPGEVVPRRFLAILGSEKTAFTSENSGRLDLAAAIASPRNPLTARVWVNRVWAACFGKPLAATASNFGFTGERPTHPELLDDLAARFMDEGGWSLKWLLREITLSATYQQSSEVDPAKAAADPENRWLAHANRRRLPVEMWRDAVFAATGGLDPALGGVSMKASDPAANRRAIYSRVSRLHLDPLLELFDFPDPSLHAEGRYETTTPLQKMFVMNHPLMIDRADALASRLDKIETTDAARIRRAYRDLFCREADPQEVALAESFLKSVPVGGAKSAWQQYAQVLLASNELVYLD